MRELAENVDRLAVVLPFEEKLFREAGANAHFVGHPLLDLTPVVQERSAFAKSLGIRSRQTHPRAVPGVARPGSGAALSALSDAPCRKCSSSAPDVQPVVAAAAGVSTEPFKRAGFPWTTDTATLLAHARAALVKSGTTTLQTALALVPMVVTYQMHPLTYQLAQRLVEVPHIALANLVAGERVVPELVQDAASPRALAAALLPLIADTNERERVVAGLRRVREQLARADQSGSAAERVAALAAELIERPA